MRLSPRNHTLLYYLPSLPSFSLPQFLDWFWPEMGWEQHKQAIVLSKRLLQPRSPNTFPSLPIDPQLHAAWRAFTYCFWHGTRHMSSSAPAGMSQAPYTAAREWLTKLVGDKGLESDGQIVSSLQNWLEVGTAAHAQTENHADAWACSLQEKVSQHNALQPPSSNTGSSARPCSPVSHLIGRLEQAMGPRLRDAFPNAPIDWAQWPAVTWPDAECGCRSVEKRGAVKRQTEEEYAVRWPLRVTQGRPKVRQRRTSSMCAPGSIRGMNRAVVQAAAHCSFYL